jgi:hypothetical protein
LREKGREEELSAPQSDGEREATVEEWKLQSKVVQEADTAIAAAAAAVNPLTAQSINHSIPHSFFCAKAYALALVLVRLLLLASCTLLPFFFFTARWWWSASSEALMQRRSFATSPQFHKPRKQNEGRMSLKMDEHIWMREGCVLKWMNIYGRRRMCP